MPEYSFLSVNASLNSTLFIKVSRTLVSRMFLPIVANEPHPRYFPYPTSFIAKDGSLTRIRYLASLGKDAACVTYLAEICDEPGMTGDPVKVVVKFVARYGEEVHDFLARHGYAPALRYCSPLPKTKLSGISGPAQSATPGLLCL